MQTLSVGTHMNNFDSFIRCRHFRHKVDGSHLCTAWTVDGSALESWVCDNIIRNMQQLISARNEKMHTYNPKEEAKKQRWVRAGETESNKKKKKQSCLKALIYIAGSDLCVKEKKEGKVFRFSKSEQKSTTKC